MGPNGALEDVVKAAAHHKSPMHAIEAFGIVQQIE
jgi:hypothetical protein